MFDETQRTILLRIAREAIEVALKIREELDLLEEGFLAQEGSAFVTITINDELRGCIGTTDAREPLGEAIKHCAVSAAFRDPRFPPLTKEEYPLIHLEISVLSPFKKVESPDEVIAGTHGVMITRGYYRGLLLPQVATEYGWDRDTFLSYTCRKAGLPPDAWKDPGTTIEIFTAEVFSESRERRL
jgi:AmmeMemoRadiSam system protein A